MDSRYYETNQLGRYGDTGFLYNIINPRNPETGAVESVSLGVIKTI